MIGLFEAAAKLEVTPPTVKAWVRKGRLKGEQVRTYGGNACQVQVRIWRAICVGGLCWWHPRSAC